MSERGIDFKKDLNPEQFAASTAPDGPVFVLAGAGTGKTRVLVYRVAHLVTQGVDPRRILLLTFTNRAAREMMERAHGIVGPEIGGVWAGTFHHMANRILRRHPDQVGYPSDFTILDRDDAVGLIAESVKRLGLDRVDFPKRDVLMSLFSSSVNTEKPLEEILENRFRDIVVDIGDIERVHRRYQDEKKRLKAMDFDDLLAACVNLFRQHEGVRKRYQEQFLHLLVDEYQDTNPIQSDIVDLLAEGRRNVLVVGDDFQSIYSWRGADFRNIMSFPERYPDARTYKLETNYRSSPEVLQVANACIAASPVQFRKVLRATRRPHRKPVVAYLRDGSDQARQVVEWIRRFARDGYKFSDIAVLYRAHFHSMELQMELSREDLDYEIVSGVRFFEQAHIKDVCCVLRLLENPSDELAFMRLMGMLPGVGPKTAEKIWGQIGGRFDSSEDMCRQVEARMKEGARGPWSRIAQVIQSYRRDELQDDGGELITRFVNDFYEAYSVKAFEDWDRRLEDIREFVLYTAKYESVEDLLSEVALLTNVDAEVGSPRDGKRDQVRLTTIHQAKGLEWPVVIILWVNEGMFPSPRSVNDNPDGEAEERRLFYVAVTRAKDELHMCVPQTRKTRDGGTILCEPSRFLRDIPRNFLRTSGVAIV